MTVDADVTVVPESPDRTGPPTPRRERREVLPAAIITITGSALVLLVVRDGSLPWQAARAVSVIGLTILAVLGMRRLGRVGAGILLFGVGLVATATGLGIALPHLAKGGPLVVQAAGTVVLVGGLASTGIGAVRLFTSAHGWRRAPVVVALLVSTYIVVPALAPAVAATNVPPTDLGAATPADHDLEYVDVSFETTDGVQLSGWYIPSRNGAAVVLAHGAGSTRSATLPHAVVLAREGYGTLLFDARGHGESGGRAMDFGWHGDEDVGAAVAYLGAQPDVEPGRIGALGLSMGGEEVLGASAVVPEIRAVVAEGATVRVAADKSWLSDEYGVRGWVQEQTEWLRFGLADLLTDARPPRPLGDAVRAGAPTPILLITAGEVSDETHAGERLREVDPERVTVWEVPRAGHTGALDTDPGEWEQRVVSFFDRALSDDPDGPFDPDGEDVGP